MKKACILTLCCVVAIEWVASTAHATPPVANPRRVICISAGNDGFLSGCEGYYRGLPAKGGAADVVQFGGQLSDCMNNVRKGDQLIIVAHGSPGQFLWSKAKGGADTPYNGYGDGTNGTYPVPPNLRGTNTVTATLVSCHSNADPTGPPIPVTQTLRNVMNAGGGVNNTVTGFDHPVNSVIGWRVGGSRDSAQINAAEHNLKLNDGWMDHPPVNRPGAGADNHRTAAEAQLNAKPEFQGKGLTVQVVYRAPEAKTEGLAQNLFTIAGPYCEGVIGIRLGTEPEVPGPSEAVLVALAMFLAVGAGGVLARRRLSSRAVSPRA